MLTAVPAVFPAASAEQGGEPISIGQRFQIESKVLGETRKYIVHTPGGYAFSNDLYPLIILLDGDTNMQHVSATADFLANNGRTMQMIVVGIENTDRQRDLTPPLTSENPDDRPPGNVGGAPRFLSFIADELIPHLDRTYRTRPTRILIGHSYGGLFVAYTLLNRPEVFKAYIAVSPALWWDNQGLIRHAQRFVADHQELQTAIYMTMGNEGGSMLGGAQQFAGVLSGSRRIGVTFQHWPEESHGSVVMRSVYEGLEWLHELYYTHDPMRVYEESGLQFFDKRFELISSYLGYEVPVPERVLMEVQHRLMQSNRPHEAVEVLQRAMALYPASTGPHYELGMVYLQTKEVEKAQAQFKQTLSLYPGHIGARTELQKLGSDLSEVVIDVQPSLAALRAYVGEYRYADETSIVTLESGKLFVKVREEKRELRARSNENFYAMDADREYTFNSKRGRTTSVTVDLPYFRYVGTKVR
jgi:hypothetical protein